MQKWSHWIRGLTHERAKNGWFVRVDDAFTDLPTKCGGVYEIAYGMESPERVAYCGRALATEAGGGTSLRSRLYSGYALNGSHLHKKMRPVLEDGNDVFFRWMILNTKEEIVETEANLIAEGEYEWNSVSAKRGFIYKLEKLIGDDKIKLKWAKEWMEHPKRV
jgi:hypothetical protein